MGIKNDLQGIKAIEDTLTSNKVANFAYTDQAYTDNDADGVAEYDSDNEQNIPIAAASVLNVNETILTKGWRSQASSVTRMLMNHFLGRISYNLNKVNDLMSSLLDKLYNAIGSADGIAPLNENGVLDYAYGGTNASTLSGAKVNLEINNVVNTGDSDNAASGGATKFTTGGAYNILTSFADIFSTSVSYSAGDLVTYQNKFYECTSSHSAGAWNSSHFTARTVSYLLKTYVLPALANVFSSTASYSTGDFVVYQNRLYRCINQAGHSGAWGTGEDFTLTNLNSINDSLDNLESDIQDMIDDLEESKADYTDLAPSFSDATSYAVGDYVIYAYNLYRCTTAHSGAWNASHFTLVTVGSDLKNKADKTSIALPSDAEVHYSFDDLPSKVPDGTYVYKRDKNFTTSDYWNRDNANFTQSIENSCLKWTWNSATAGTAQANTYISNLSNKYCVLKIKANITQGNVTFVMLATANGTLRRLADTRLNNGDNFISFIVPANISNYIIWQVTNMSQNDYIIFESIYFGNGSDSMPVLDNSGNGHNIANAGIVKADGVCGSSALFAGGANNVLQTVTVSEYNRTFSLWFGLSVFSSGVLFSNNNGFYIQVNSGRLVLHYGSDSVDLTGVTASSYYIYDYYHLAVVCDNNYINVYLNGVLLKTVSVTVSRNANMIYLGALDANGTNGFFGKIDDFQIFNRTLSLDEVTALYLNRANTPKFYDINNYNLEHCDVASVGGSGKYIESVSQTDGKLSAVAQNLDTLPVQNSQKPLTSGALYNFFGGNTDYNTWLGKVFGWALGRKWSQGSGGTDYTFIDVCFGADKWVAVGSNGIWASTNGKEWTLFQNIQSMPTKVYFANNLFVVTTDEGIYYSAGGTIWNKSDSGRNIHFTDVWCHENKWVAVSTSGTRFIWESSDGISWNQTASFVISLYGTSVRYGGGKWVATFYDTNSGSSDSEGSIAYSSGDGSWDTPNRSPINKKCYSSCYANGLWVVGTSSGLYWCTETTYFASWTQVSGTSGVKFNYISYADGIWVAGSDNGVWWSANGKSWNRGEGLDGINSVAFYKPYYANGLWVIPCNNHIFYSADGKRWTMGRFGNDANINCNSVFYNNGIWVGACTPLCGLWYSDYTNADLQ